MGMFDNIEYQGRQYQTKDTPLQMLDNYKIAQDHDSGHWYLWHEDYDAEWSQEQGQLFGGTLVQSNWRWTRCDDFDGDIRFYYYRPTEQEEYRAVFRNGQLIRIRLTSEPLTAWYQKGVDDAGLEP